MHERHPVETSPRYHVVIWIITGLVAAGLVYGIVQRVNEPPAELPARRAAPKQDSPPGAGEPARDEKSSARAISPFIQVENKSRVPAEQIKLTATSGEPAGIKRDHLAAASRIGRLGG